MPVARFNLGWLFVMLMLGPLPGQAQIRRAFDGGTGNQTNRLTIIWNPSPSDGVTGYALYWGVSPEACTNRLALGDVTNVTLVGFKAKATYHFAVAAYDPTGEESPWSNFIQYSLPARPTPSLVVPEQFGLKPAIDSGTNSAVRVSFMGQAGGKYQLQGTHDFQHWEVLLVTNCERRQSVIYEIPATGSHRFFRLTPQ